MQQSQPTYLNYIQNKGQWEDKVLFRAGFRGGTVFLENSAFTFLFYENDVLEKVHRPLQTINHTDSATILKFHAVQLKFEGALQNHPVTTGNVEPFYHNYFKGSDPKKWASHVPVCKNVAYKNLYPNIDVLIFGRGNNVRYDFNISPGGKPSDIRMRYTGHNKLALRDGKLIIYTSVGEIEQQAPDAYQKDKRGTITKVACHYVLLDNELSIEVTGAYDKNQMLTIDPTLVFATYTGSIADNWGMSASYDMAGNGYTTGECFDVGYPVTTGAFQTTYASGNIPGANTDIAVSKFNPSGTQLLFSTYLGGRKNDLPHSLTVDRDDNLLLFGHSFSPDFPVMQGCYNTSLTGTADITVTKFNATGTAILASTFIGGSADDGVNLFYPLNHNYGDHSRGAIHVDENNDVYIVSCTSSSNFPVTPGCLQPSLAGLQDACVFKISSGLSSLMFSTYLGGTDHDAAYNFSFDSENKMYITGGTNSSNFPITPGVIHPTAPGQVDGFITHLSNSGNTILHSSYIGTNDYDQSYFVQVDKRDNVYLYGQCNGNYPITPGTYSNANSGQFIHKLNRSLSTTLFSTEFGAGQGKPDISPSAFLVDNCDNIYVAGWGGASLQSNLGNSMAGMPLTNDAFQPSTDGSDFYFAVFTRNAATLHYGTNFGGATSHEHVDGGTSAYDKSGVIYQAICAGCGGHSDTPTTPGAWSNTNGSPNCNNALVKFKMDLRPTVAQIDLRPFIKTGCKPFTPNLINNSINAITYAWDFNDGFTSTAVTPAHTFTNIGTYTVTLIAFNLASCNIADTTHMVINVVANSVPQVSPYRACKSDSVKLELNMPTVNSFSWIPVNSLSNPGIYNPVSYPLETTIYSVTVKDTICRITNTITVKVTVNENKTRIRSNQAGLCTNDTVRLSTTLTYSNYFWSTGDTSPRIRINQKGTYFIKTIDSAGCKGADSIRINGLAIARLDSFNIALCKGQSTQLFVPTGSYKYKWSPSSFLSGDTIHNPVANPEVSTLYTITVSNEACKNSGLYRVSVNPLPFLSIGEKTISAIVGERIVLNATADSTCYWYPPDWLSCDSCKTTIATPENNMLYTCRVSNKFGCIVTSSVVIELAPTLYIPNSFTPNDDGINDVFQPVFTGFTKMSITIFDRWGAEVYSYSNLDGGWNGRYRSNPAKMDVYVYKLDATDFTNKRHEKTGFVNLIR